MIGMCIYKTNRGLGACVGPVSKVRVASKRTAAWKGLNDLAERLKESGEEPGVCKSHEKRAGENGYLLASDAPAPRKVARRASGTHVEGENPCVSPDRASVDVARARGKKAGTRLGARIHLRAKSGSGDAVL